MRTEEKHDFVRKAILAHQRGVLTLNAAVFVIVEALGDRLLSPESLVWARQVIEEFEIHHPEKVPTHPKLL